MAESTFWTEERRALADLAAKFTEREIVPQLGRWEKDGRLPRALQIQAANSGLLGVGFPEDIGGSGGSLVDVVAMTEAMIQAGASGGLMSALFTHGISLPHVIDRAREMAEGGVTAEAGRKMFAEVVRPVLAGETVMALAITEPDGGSDVARLRSTAREDGDIWRVTGNKTFITSGVRADHYVVAARTGGRGAAGISLGLVRASDPGVSVVRQLDKMGWRCSDTAELSFQDAEYVPLGRERGFASLARHFPTERIFLAVIAYATAQRCLDITREYVTKRETFGEPLNERQVIRHTLVEMHRQIDVARVYTRDVAMRHVQGEMIGLQAVLAKQTAVDACMYVVDRAVQLHGGTGYMADSEVERHYRDARVLGIGGGATEVMSDLAASLLGI